MDGRLEMAGTPQTKPAKFAAADFRIKRSAKPTSSRNKPISTHTTNGRLTITEQIPERLAAVRKIKSGDETAQARVLS
jgi:hypothetical protein